ncbi:acyl-CoA synthetase [Jongsikchunia kroppenstedtii]|uniref:acyl-CoA synthetase n=1 Tax=Jongsikchunia kroppenstedtii TaxID=1121721 RepID=UPI00035EFD27|nr:long-chain fatty acid--CoA ligase [Jongsikchunia kroppenstedtii]
MHLTQGLHRSVQQKPNEVAVIDGDREISYADLLSRVARLGAVMRGAGVESGDRIGILATNSAMYLECVLACAWIGAVLSPINNRWSPDEMAFQVDDAGISMLIADPAHRETVTMLAQRDSVLKAVVTDDYDERIESAEPIDDVYADPDALAVLMYTGGTTGRSKGVMLSARQILTSGYGTFVSAGLPNYDERVLHVSPLFHLAAFGGMMQHVILGSTHVFMGDFAVDKLVDTIAEKQITIVTLVPTMVQRMLDHADSTGVNLSSLRSVGYGSAPMPQPVVARLAELLPDVTLRQAYGMTELGPVATVLRDEDHRNPEHPERRGSVGKAAMHAEVRVVDSDDVEVPRGDVGEIVCRGENMMMGYWRRPEETAAALRGGWMHTGDLGYMDAHGYVYLVDRLKDMIVSGGENVYSAEVEKVLIHHPAVASCAVIGVPDRDWGERVHAVIVSEPGVTVTAAEIRDYVGARIARYKAPRTVDFVEQMPLSPVGKILKRVLRDQYSGPRVNR